jgi:PsbP-like protein
MVIVSIIRPLLAAVLLLAFIGTGQFVYAQIPGVTSSQDQQQTSPLQQQQQQQQPTSNTQSDLLTYDNPDGLFKIQYPSAWEVLENKYRSSVTFGPPIQPDKFFREPNFSVLVTSAAKYLDTNDLQVKVKTPQQYVTEKIANDSAPSSVGTFKIIRSEPATVDGNSAWRLDYGLGLFGHTSYVIELYVLNSNKTKLYVLSFESEPLHVPENLPTMKKMLDSFQMIQ